MVVLFREGYGNGKERRYWILEIFKNVGIY